MDVVWHNLQCKHFQIEVLAVAFYDVSQDITHPASEDSFSVFGYPNNVVIDVVLGVGRSYDPGDLDLDIVHLWIEMREIPFV